MAGPSPFMIEARRLLAERRARETHFPGLGDAAFTMLLRLGVSQGEGRTESVTALCLASFRPTTTALRHLGVLRELGLINRVGDCADRRREFIVLTAEGAAALVTFLGEITPSPGLGRGPAHAQRSGVGPIFDPPHWGEIADG